MSEVAPQGADRQEAPTPADGGRRRVGRALAALLIAVAAATAGVLAATSGLRNDEIVDRASALGALGSETPVAPGHPPVFRGLRFPDLSAEGWQPVDGRRDVVGDRVAAFMPRRGGTGDMVIELRVETPVNLTSRQKEVLQLLTEGRSMKEMARILDITPRTIAFHKYSMMEHLNIKSNAELIAFAMSHLPPVE